MAKKTKSESEIVFYQTEDGRTRLEVKLENETVWLTQAQMEDLFQRERSVITKHIRNVFKEGELLEEAVCANHARTARKVRYMRDSLEILNRIAEIIP